MLLFILGLIVGGTVGGAFIALLQVNREEEDDSRYSR